MAGKKTSQDQGEKHQSPGEIPQTVNSSESLHAEKLPTETESVKTSESSKREHQSIKDTEIQPLTIELLKEKWPRITERIKSPPLRMSLKNGLPLKVEDKTVTLQFNTNFHKNKVMEHDNRVELEEIIEENLGSAVKIVSIVKELEIKPVVEEIVSRDYPVVEKEKKGDLMNEALDIFGGEVVG